MAVPDYQTLMLPVLESLADGATRSTYPEITDHIAKHFHLTQEDLDERFASGQPAFYNRTQWAVTYLGKAGLIARVGRGKVAITERGKDVLASKPDRVDVNYLRRFPEFEEFRTKTRVRDTPTAGRRGHRPRREPGGAPVRDVRVAATGRRGRHPRPPPVRRVVVVVLRTTRRGRAGQDGLRVGRRGDEPPGHEASGDDGIDGVIDEDRLGLDAVYIQAKKYAETSPVGRPALQAFAGSLDGQRASKGVFITTSHFTGDAEDYVKRISKRIVLIDGKTLARLMYEYGVGVRTRRTLDVKRVDEAYFEGDV